ncbi:MAG: response regulator [Candidatus Zixiibacteriota bacterium]
MKALLIARNNERWNEISRWLHKTRWTVQNVPSCRLGLKAIQADPEIDLVLIDGAGAENYGLSFVNAIKRDHRLYSIPVIVGGHDISEDLVAQYGALGVDNIILLPTSRETFEAKVLRAMQSGKPNVLVVDDDSAIRELVSDFLVLERYRPLQAESVDQALAVLEKGPVDVVITDIMMPGKTGLDLLVHVKQTYPDIPVIMITGHVGQYTPDKVIAMGADGYFAKPFHNLELVYTLRKVRRDRPKVRVTTA